MLKTLRGFQECGRHTACPCWHLPNSLSIECQRVWLTYCLWHKQKKKRNVSLSFYKIMKLFIVLNSRLCAWLGYYLIFYLFWQWLIRTDLPLVKWWESLHYVVIYMNWTYYCVSLSNATVLSDWSKHTSLHLSLSFFPV